MHKNISQSTIFLAHLAILHVDRQEVCVGYAGGVENDAFTREGLEVQGELIVRPQGLWNVGVLDAAVLFAACTKQI